MVRTLRSDSKQAEHLTAFTGWSSPLPLFTGRPGARGASLLSPTEAAGRPPRGQPVTASSGTHPLRRDAPSAPGEAGPGPCWTLGCHRPSFSNPRSRALPQHTLHIYIEREIEREISHLLYPFICSVDGHLGCCHILDIINYTGIHFHILTVVNNTATRVHAYFQVDFFSDIYPAVELLDHLVVLFLVFSRNLKIVLQSGRTNLHSHPRCTGLFFLHALSNTGYLMQSVVIIINNTSKLLEDEI